MNDDALRTHLARLLDWEDAHATFDHAVAELAAPLRGRRTAGLPHSPWELLEHLRITQRDILDFCRAPEYAERAWPAEYWPGTPEPPSGAAWEASVAAYRADREALKRLAAEVPELAAPVPNGSGQSYLRELLLAADHAAYHVGQLVLVRRLLGAWPPPETKPPAGA
jgi:uncharacterized damage-inducible protein DinB